MARENKKRIKDLLLADNWRQGIPLIAEAGSKSLGPLFSLLLADPQTMHRAAVAIGQTVATIAARDYQSAQDICRRFMWHMNEDSGNIGWGIPEAFAETLCANPKLADTYAPILISYIMDLGHADNFCDYDILRRSCYWAVGRLAKCRPDLVQNHRQWLIKGLSDNDALCRGFAAWALLQLPPHKADAKYLQGLADENEICEIFENGKMVARPIKAIAAELTNET